MKDKLLIIVILSFFFMSTLQQVTLPLVHKKVSQTESDNHHRHNLAYQGRPSHSSTTNRSKLSHNIQYIKSHYYQSCLLPPSESPSPSNPHRPHHLTLHTSYPQSQQQQSTHLKLQTFNLQPNMYAFTLPMIIGGYEYSMSIDSGSSDIFIKGEKTKGKQKKRYHCGEKCINSNQHYTLGYLDGHLKAYEIKLEVELGDKKFMESVLVAYQIDQNFQENQGLVGLSFPQLATNPNPTFIQTLQNQKIIDEYAFGVNLNFQNKDRSFITFGSYDPQFFEGQLSMYPLTSNLFYYIRSQGVSIGDGELLKINRALFDTGNTCISIPQKFKADILKKFNQGKGQKQNLCYFSVEQHADMFAVLRCKVGSFDALPTLNIHLGNKTFSIQKQFYMQACDRRPSEIGSQQIDKGFWYCDMYIETVSGMSELFLGDGFFNRYYTYFDLERHQVGIAKNKEKISLEHLIENDLDAQQDDWIEILTTLNPDEKEKDIKFQAQQVQTDDEQDEQYYDEDEKYQDNEGGLQGLWNQFMDFIGVS